MKTQSSTSTNQNSKKGKDKLMEKNIQKEKEKKNEQKNIKKEPELESEEFFTDEEIRMLDKFHKISNNHFSDDEIYDIMLRFNNNEHLIENEIKEMLKDMSRGDEFNWTEIGKSNSIFYFLIF